MNKKRLWLLALSMATMVTANTVVMAATTDKQNLPNDKWHPRQTMKGDFGKNYKPPMGFHEDKKALMDFLKIDDQTFRTKAKEGKTLAEIAKDQGISEQSLTDFMVEQMSARIDKAEREGKLPPDADAAQMKAGIEKRVADIINGKMPKYKPDHRHMHHPLFDNTKLLELLHMDKEFLVSEMHTGKTLAVIAKEHNVSEQKLKDVITIELTQHINEDVKIGRLTQERANKMKANMEKHITNMINDKAPRPEYNMPPMGHGLFHNQHLLNLLNIDAENLKTELDEGKSLLTIAKEHDVSEQNLKELLQNDMSDRLAQSVQEGRLSSDKANEIKANMAKHIDDLINGNIPMKKPHHSPTPQE